MVPYSKPYKTASDLVTLLQTRGLAISNTLRAERYISNIGYYRLSAYMFPFLRLPKTDHKFKTGVSFDNVLDLYRFDKKLRVLIFNEVEKLKSLSGKQSLMLRPRCPVTNSGSHLPLRIKAVHSSKALWRR